MSDCKIVSNKYFDGRDENNHLKKLTCGFKSRIVLTSFKLNVLT